MSAGVLVIVGGLALVAVALAAAQAASGTSPSPSPSSSSTGAGSGSSPGASSSPPAAGSTSGTGTLAPKAGQLLTPKQRQFASQLQANTGLDPRVIAGWLLAEESSGAAQSRDAANNNDWLNIGYTDTATLGAGNSVWNDPTTAANATAAWIKGTWSDPGFGSSAPGIRQILTTVGQSINAQVSAIQHSGWASGGYPSLSSLVSMVS